MCCAVLCCAVLCCAVLCCAVLSCAILSFPLLPYSLTCEKSYSLSFTPSVLRMGCAEWIGTQGYVWLCCQGQPDWTKWRTEVWSSHVSRLQCNLSPLPSFSIGQLTINSALFFLRSLVALSLVLALLLFKPAPLYILDEVDSALDLSHTQVCGCALFSEFISFTVRLIHP
jgi:hypothetical protein